MAAENATITESFEETTLRLVEEFNIGIFKSASMFSDEQIQCIARWDGDVEDKIIAEYGLNVSAGENTWPRFAAKLKAAKDRSKIIRGLRELAETFEGNSKNFVSIINDGLDHTQKDGVDIDRALFAISLAIDTNVRVFRENATIALNDVEALRRSFKENTKQA